VGVFKLTKEIEARYPWLLNYAKDRAFPPSDVKSEGPKHILFTFVDHFEPHDQAAVDRWMKTYPPAADKHHDADGRVPQHTWFWYFSESKDPEKLHFLQNLAELSYQGYGEVELHLHHFNDTEKTFLEKINGMIQLSQQTGAMITSGERPQTAFGFIHGLWSLDNSRGPGACGVNNELILLRRVGCYADFTHASWGVMTPKTVNRLYYAIDDPLKPKSYDSGPEMTVGHPASGDLLIFEGPTVVRLGGLRPSYDHGDVTHVDLPTPERVDDWIKTNIHVRGRPEWVFVKIFTHGALAEDHEAILGEWMNSMHSYLEKRYNDGKNYVLHYVTAREAYNMAKAAEAGKSGNPNLYHDFLIPPYVNHFFIASVPFETIAVSAGRATVRFLVPAGTAVKVRMRAEQVVVSGEAEPVKVEPGKRESVITLVTQGSGAVTFAGKKVSG